MGSSINDVMVSRVGGKGYFDDSSKADGEGRVQNGVTLLMDNLYVFSGKIETKKRTTKKKKKQNRPFLQIWLSPIRGKMFRQLSSLPERLSLTFKMVI